MKWYEISKKRPPYGKYIWVWDANRNFKFLLKYHGCQETWEETKHDRDFPIWAYLNDEEDDNDRTDNPLQ